jgi:hypothetical protein
MLILGIIHVEEKLEGTIKLALTIWDARKNIFLVES